MIFTMKITSEIYLFIINQIIFFISVDKNGEKYYNILYMCNLQIQYLILQINLYMYSDITII